MSILSWVFLLMFLFAIVWGTVNKEYKTGSFWILLMVGLYILATNTSFLSAMN